MRTIKTVQQFKEFVGDNGKLFSVTFTKKDGTTRSMVARLGVKSQLKGKGMLYSPESRNNVVVFSMKDRAYRTINVDRLIKVKAFGEVVEVVQR
jgi:hypothetical protein